MKICNFWLFGEPWGRLQKSDWEFGISHLYESTCKYWKPIQIRHGDDTWDTPIFPYYKTGLLQWKMIIWNISEWSYRVISYNNSSRTFAQFQKKVSRLFPDHFKIPCSPHPVETLKLI